MLRLVAVLIAASLLVTCKKRKPPKPPQTQTGTGTGAQTQTGTPSDPQEGTYGYGEYTWNFCAGGAWSYRSYYYAGSTVESNNGGYRFGVELRGGGGYMKTNAKDFEEGTFTRQVGAAVC